MSELQVVEHPTSYGSRHEGVVVTEDRTIGVTLRAPFEDEWTGITYVLPHCWTAGKNSMRPTALEVVNAGHQAITFDYTHTGITHALESNAADCAAVMDALPDDTIRRAVGLSMGGPVVTMAILQAESKFEIVTQVAAAGYINRKLTPWKIAKHLLDEGRELPSLYRDPVHALHLTMGVMHNCVDRPLAVIGEFDEMISGTVHDALRRIKHTPDAPYMRFMYGSGDRLFPAAAQLEGVRNPRFDEFDEVVPYNGGHMQLARGDSILARAILALDAELILPSSTCELSLAA